MTSPDIDGKKFIITLFEQIGQAIEQDKIKMSDKTFDKIEDMAFKLLDEFTIIAIGDRVCHIDTHYQGIVVSISEDDGDSVVEFMTATNQSFTSSIYNLKKIV